MTEPRAAGSPYRQRECTGAHRAGCLEPAGWQRSALPTRDGRPVAKIGAIVYGYEARPVASRATVGAVTQRAVTIARACGDRRSGSNIDCRALSRGARGFEVFPRFFVLGYGPTRAASRTRHAGMLLELHEVHGIDGRELIVGEGLARPATTQRRQRAIAVVLASAPVGCARWACCQARRSGGKAVGIAAAAAIHEWLAHARLWVMPKGRGVGITWAGHLGQRAQVSRG
jgi:hypothetical protein